LDAYNRRDLDGLLELATEDYVLFAAVAGVIEVGGIRGREGLRRYFDMLDETWVEFRLIADEFRDLGDCVLAIGRTEGRGRGSGVPVDSPYRGAHGATSITAKGCGRRASPSSRQAPVSGVRPSWARARDECFHGDAGASPLHERATAGEVQRASSRQRRM
jgi:ketosteroid isomerase-like protein